MKASHLQQGLFWALLSVGICLVLAWSFIGENGLLPRNSLMNEHQLELRELEKIELCNEQLEHQLYRLERYPSTAATAINDRLLMAPEGARIYLFDDGGLTDSPCEPVTLGKLASSDY